MSDNKLASKIVSWSDQFKTARKPHEKLWKECFDYSFPVCGLGIATVVKLALDNGWRPDKKEMTAEDKARLKKEAEECRDRALKEAEEDERLTKKMQAKVAEACFKSGVSVADQRDTVLI